MNLSIKALNYFLTAVDLGSITRAAKKLHVVPSAVSSAVDQVEQEFDLKLVMRYPSKGISATATGRTLVGKIRHLIEEYENLISEGVDLRTALTGTLRIGYFARIAPAFFPAIIRPLIDGNPGVNLKFIECDNETAQGGLLNGDFDVILFFESNVRPGIAYETLLEVAAFVIAAHDHPLAGQKSVSLADLADHPLVLLDLPLNSEYYREILEDAGLTSRVVATATTTEMIRSLVGAGVGCSILHMQPKINTSYAGDPIVAIPIDPPARSLQLVLGHLEGNRRALVHAFIENCREYFASDAAKKLIVTSASNS